MTIEEISWEAELDLSTVGSSVQEAINTKKLFRYQFKDTKSYVNILEDEVKVYTGTNFALGVSSATNAIFLALKSLGVDNTSKVLIPAFTFTAVPSAVMQCGASPVLVDITENYVIDLEDLEKKIVKSNSKFLLLSHMRGHLCDMDEVVRICDKYSVILIEDAAHALGVKWNGKQAGTFGIAGIYSLQSYKVINAGEGGLLVTNDPEIFWKCVFMSGSYENNYLLHSTFRHEVAERFKNKLPVFNVRMNNITAAIAIPQIKSIEETIERINYNYSLLSDKLSVNNSIIFCDENSSLRPVRDSAQMRIKLDEKKREELKLRLNQEGIPISYFGGKNNTNARLYENWNFLPDKNQELPNTKKNLSEVFDLRLPIHFTQENITMITNKFIKILEEVINN